MEFKVIFLILWISLFGISCSSISMPQPTGELIPGIYAVRNNRNNIPFLNFYLIKTKDGYIAECTTAIGPLLWCFGRFTVPYQAGVLPGKIVL